MSVRGKELDAAALTIGKEQRKTKVIAAAVAGLIIAFALGLIAKVGFDTLSEARRIAVVDACNTSDHRIAANESLRKIVEVELVIGRILDELAVQAGLEVKRLRKILDGVDVPPPLPEDVYADRDRLCREAENLTVEKGGSHAD